MLADGLKRSWTPLADAGIPVVAMAGTPRMTASVPDCLAENSVTPEVCGRKASEALGQDAAIRLAAAEMMNSATLVDMTAGLCTPSYCPAVAGNVVVYRDENHLTVEYARTLGGLLSQKLETGN
jgi:hypothetical protein